MKTGESSSPQQSDLANKALDAIRKNIEAAAADGNIDEAEMRELGKLYVAKLQELGLATKRAINGLKEELTQGLRGINAQIDAIGKWAILPKGRNAPGELLIFLTVKDDEQAPGTRAPDLRGTLPPPAQRTMQSLSQ